MRTVTLPHPSSPAPRVLEAVVRIVPGVLLSIVVTGLAFLLQHGEQRLFGRAWLEALVLAILVGTIVRTVWNPDDRWTSGIHFSAKTLLEIAVVLLGATVSGSTILAAGPRLLFGIMAVVGIAILASFAIGRVMGLAPKMALLVACGNSICGNSAIAAVAPVIGADSDDVAAAIGFTAVLGVAVVLGLPLIGVGLHLSGLQYGALAGLTVYAVPQVLAATAPLGATAVQMGTLVKLVRVLMLGPVSLVLSLLAPRLSGGASVRRAPALHHLVPWFILGFLGLVIARSFGLVPQVALAPAGDAATMLTVVSMAALGLGVDVRTVAGAGGRVTAAVILSLLVLGGISFGLIRLLGIA
jgi:uncharacterized integral membrane protein (TIGR00698 family)